MPRDARQQRLDVAVGAIEGRDLGRDPVLGEAPAALDQVRGRSGASSARVRLRHHVAEVGDLAHVPEQAHRLRRVAPAGAPRDPRARAASARWSSASRMRIEHGRRRARARGWQQERRGRGEDEVRVAPEDRVAAARSGAPRPPSTSRSSKGPRSAVAPKVPSRTWRPARPAIWATSAGRSGRGPAAVELAEAR